MRRSGDASARHGFARHGYVGSRSRILDAEVNDGGVANLQGL